MIRFACQQCGKEFSVADEHAGQKARCKKCGAIITIAAAPAASPARASNGSGAQATSPQAASARRAAPVRSAQPPAQRAIRPPAATPAAASANDPLGGLNIDLGALGPLDAPPLPAMSAAPLGASMTLGGGVSLGQKYTKKKKSGNLLLWLVFSGTGLAAFSIVAILVATLINLPGSVTFPDNPTAYLPADSVIAASVRLRNLLDRASSIPQAKPQIDQALSAAISEGLDPRDLDELFMVSDGTNSSIAARTARPIDPLTLKGTVATGESHQGLPIYSVKSGPRPQTGMAMPAPETLYMVLPRPQLLVGSTDPQRLKAAIDQAKERRNGAIDLPSGHDLALRIKDFSQLERGAALPTGAASSDLVGLTGTLDWNDKFSLDVQLDMKDAQKATELDQKIKSFLQMLAMLSKQGQPNAPDLSSAIKVSVAGAQLRLSASMLASQLSSLAASAPGPPGMPADGTAPVGMPAGTPPGQTPAGMLPGGIPPGGEMQPMPPPGTPPIR